MAGMAALTEAAHDKAIIVPAMTVQGGTKRIQARMALLTALTYTPQSINSYVTLIVDLLNGYIRLCRQDIQGVMGDDIADMIGIPEFAIIMLFDRLQ
jgi:hypothetical protein